MHSERDVTRMVRAWLRTGERESADRVLDDVLALIDRNTQRRSSWTWRLSARSHDVRIGLTAAAAVVVAFLGYQLLGDNVGAPGLSSSPSTEPTVTAAGPSPTSGHRPFRSMDGFRFSFELPDSRWEDFGSEYPSYVSKSIRRSQGAEAVVSWQPFPGGPFGEACYYLRDKAGSSIAVLAAAVAAVPGTDLIEGPTEVTVGGRIAQHVVFVVREDVGCDPGFFFTYPNAYGGALWPETWPGDTVRVWIVNVNGAFFIEGKTHEDASPELVQEVQQIVDSIQFE